MDVKLISVDMFKCFENTKNNWKKKKSFREDEFFRLGGL